MNKVKTIIGIFILVMCSLVFVSCDSKNEIAMLKNKIKEMENENNELKAIIISSSSESSPARDKIRPVEMTPHSVPLFAQDEDTVLYADELELIQGDNNIPKHAKINTRFAETGDKVFIELDSDIVFTGEVSYAIAPSETVANGTRIILNFERKLEE